MDRMMEEIMDQIMKATLTYGRVLIVAYFRIVGDQEFAARNFVTSIAHNAMMQSDCAIIKALPARTRAHDAMCSSVEKVVGRCVKMINRAQALGIS